MAVSGAAQGAAGGRVVRQPHGHEEAADIGVAEPERAVIVGEPRDLLRRELRHQHRDFEDQRPQADEVLVAVDVEDAGRAVVEGEQVGGGEIAGRVVQEHVFGARIGRADRTAGRAGVPLVHGGVEMQAGIGRGPGGVADPLPQFTGRQRLRHLAADAAGQAPVAVLLDGAQKVVGDGDGVVGVLPRHREIGLAVPIGVVDVELDVLVALPGELDDALDVVVRHGGAARELDLALERRVLVRIVAILARALAIEAGLHDGLEMFLAGLGAGHEGGDLLLLAHLPVDEGLDVRMVDVDDDHLGGAARGAARLDGAGGAVADLQERHEAGRLAAAGQLLALAAQPGEVGAGAGAVFEQARLAHPQVHDAALVDEVVLDALDEAGMRLRVLVGRRRLGELAGDVVDVEMALAGAVDAVGPVQPGIEPLRRVRRAHLQGEHGAQLVVEGARILLGREIAALPAPIGPAAGEAVEDLLGRGLGHAALALGQGREGGLVGDRAPQPGRDAVLLDLFEARRDPGLAEILLRQHVGGDLAPRFRHLDPGLPEDDRAVRILDLADGETERDGGIGRLPLLSVAPLDPHQWSPLPPCASPDDQAGPALSGERRPAASGTR